MLYSSKYYLENIWGEVDHDVWLAHYTTDTDYKGKYNPMDDIGGPVIFDELMESIDDDEELEYVLEEYNLSREDLSEMDFEKKYEKGSQIKISK